MKIIMYIVSNTMNFYESHEDHMHSYQMTAFTTLPGKTLIRFNPAPLSSLLYSLRLTLFKLFVLHWPTRLNLFYFGLHRRPKKLHSVSTASTHKTVTMKVTESTLTLTLSVFVVFTLWHFCIPVNNHKVYRTTLATKKKWCWTNSKSINIWVWDTTS